MHTLDVLLKYKNSVLLYTDVNNYSLLHYYTQDKL